MKSLSYIFLVAIFALAAAVNVHADPGSPGFGMGPGFGVADPELMIEHMADHLDLDDSQRASIQRTLEAVRPQAEALREKVQSNREALHALETSDPAYETTLNNLALSQGQLATEATLLAARVRSEIGEVLTDEQRAKLERGRSRMKTSFGRRTGRR